MIVIVAFVFAWSYAMNRNQQLSDKLLDLALNNRNVPQQTGPVVVNPPAPANNGASEALKPVLEQLAAVTAALKDSKAPSAPSAIPAGADDTATRRLAARLDQQEDALRAERTKLREAQDKLHQMEVEQQRRRLYPDYYAKQDREGAPVTAAVPVQTVPSPSPVAVRAQVPPTSGKTDELQPISYFKEEAAAAPAPTPTESVAKPAMTQAAAPKGTVDYILPVDTKRQGTVSWRVYIPE